ncbi:MAG: hypothetical protein KDI67_13225 [Gammaproteobacteria bacterium]|nr:hypothetical protein [Gammaproteobacteria bacterium]MCP5439894.1 hypothetical protein [Chromatiaceae bacterium]HPE80366.1 hypothetical protein [Gammaproteobacteria bacterium]
MRYEASEGVPPAQEMQIYSQSSGLHFMLNFTVALALIIGLALLWLGRRGRVLWLQVWSAGLVLFSVAYLVAAAFGWIR